MIEVTNNANHATGVLSDDPCDPGAAQGCKRCKACSCAFQAEEAEELCPRCEANDAIFEEILWDSLHGR